MLSEIAPSARDCASIPVTADVKAPLKLMGFSCLSSRHASPSLFYANRVPLADVSISRRFGGSRDVVRRALPRAGKILPRRALPVPVGQTKTAARRAAVVA